MKDNLRAAVRGSLDELKDHELTEQEARIIVGELSPLAGDKPLFDRKSLQKFGRAGGRKLKRQRGPGYYQRIGKLGGRPPKKKLRKRRGHGQHEENR